MKPRISLDNALEIVASVVALAAILGVLQTFIIGKHYVIPTMILFLAVTFGNLARFGFRGALWAKHVLFWIFCMLAVHAFFALFWAAKPREIFGAAFPWLYGGFLLVITALLIPYAKRNRLFSAPGSN
ncbi:MAG: hypothetical protein KJO31_16215 [Gammaproteobacteria bacterium]|nr:hypothetical protein [Gammaproteobacteria bacterium]